MTNELLDVMQVGVVHFMAFPQTMGGDGPVAETLASICQDDFFTSVEITEVNDPQERRRVADILRVAQMEVGFGAQPIQLTNRLDINSDDAAVRRAGVERLKRATAAARELGATKFALMSGPDPGPKARPAAMDTLVESLETICQSAGDAGMEVALEVFDRGVDKKALIGSTEDAVKVAARVRRSFPEFGLMLDLSHLPLQGEESRTALTLAQDYLSHIHIGNCVLDPDSPGYGDTHPPFGVPEGENDVPELADFLRVLVDIGYLNPGAHRTVAFEVRPREGDTPELVLANAKRTLRRAWRQVRQDDAHATPQTVA